MRPGAPKGIRRPVRRSDGAWAVGAAPAGSPGALHDAGDEMEVRDRMNAPWNIRSARRRGAWALAAMLALALPAPRTLAQDAATVGVRNGPAVDELLANPCLADGAAGWRLENARAVDGAGPDDAPAVLLEGKPASSKEWSSLGCRITALGRPVHLTLSARAQSLGPGQSLWLGVNAYRSDPASGDWHDLGETGHYRDLTPGDWVEVSLDALCPAKAEMLEVRLTTRGERPVLVADLHLGPPPAPRTPLPGGLSVSELARLASVARSSVAAARQSCFFSATPAKLVDSDTMQCFIRSDTEGSGDEDLEEQALRLLGLWPEGPGLTESWVDDVGEVVSGAYDTGNGVVLVRAGVPEDMLPHILLHEMTHALDEQHHPWWTQLPVGDTLNADESLALACVTEGSATLTQMSIAGGCLPGGDQGEDEFSGVSGLTGRADVPDLTRRRFGARYVLGLRFLTHGHGLRTPDDFVPSELDAAFADLPASMEQVLHPEKYWDPAQRDLPRAPALDDLAASLGSEWSRRATGTLGELVLTGLVGRAVPTASTFSDLVLADWTDPATAGWDGDEWHLYRRGDGAAVLLVTLWDGVEDAREFARAAKVPGNSIIAQLDDAVIIAAGNAGIDRDSLSDLVAAAATCACAAP